MVSHQMRKRAVQECVGAQAQEPKHLNVKVSLAKTTLDTMSVSYHPASTVQSEVH